MTAQEDLALSFLEFVDDVLWAAGASVPELVARLGEPDIGYTVGDKEFLSWSGLDMLVTEARVSSLTASGATLRDHRVLGEGARRWMDAVASAEDLRQILETAGERFRETPSGSEESGDWQAFRLENGIEIDVSDTVIGVTWHRR